MLSDGSFEHETPAAAGALEGIGGIVSADMLAETSLRAGPVLATWAAVNPFLNELYLMLIIIIIILGSW